MESIRICGGNKLRGTITIGGAKNSAVALIPAAILSDRVVIDNVPDISDVKALGEILTYLNCDFMMDGDQVIIDSTGMENKALMVSMTSKLRASYYFMGALLGKYGRVEMCFPGGCEIGARPMDLHLKGFEALGATVVMSDDRYVITCSSLVGSDIDLDFPSVGATVNILLAACTARGRTVIRNAAKEPEIDNLIDLINSMGGKVSGKGSSVLVIDGVRGFSGGKARVIPDRIEAGTYVIAGVMKGDRLRVDRLNPRHIKSLTDRLILMGADIEIGADYVIASESKLKSIDIVTEVYPGFPTDLQQPMTSLLVMADGVSSIKETIYENRFQNVPYLNSMGADIDISSDTVIIKGPRKFRSGEVITTDLRAGAALILAALCAEGVTTIKDIKYVLRGYENIINKLSGVGAYIEMIDV